MAPGSTTGSVTGNNNNGNHGIKTSNPAEFTGKRTQVKTFKLQCHLAFSMEPEKWTSQHKRLMYIVSYMKGPAFEFIQPHLEDYLGNLSKPDDRKESTRRILGSDNRLFEEIRSTFGYGNEQQEAEREIQALRQRGSATKYKAEFQILAARLDWDDNALAALFYQGLKDNIKDELSRDERPDTLREMSETAIRIDTRIWERQLEQKGGFNPVRQN